MILEHDKVGDSRTKAKICISRNITLNFDQIYNNYDKNKYLETSTENESTIEWKIVLWNRVFSSKIKVFFVILLRAQRLSFYVILKSFCVQT